MGLLSASVVRHLRFEKKIILTVSALERPILHYYANFCGDWSYCCRDIAIFCFFFLVKCKNSPNDDALIWHNFAVVISN